MATGRAISLALPPTDPRSAEIRALLDALPPGADASAELRRLICLGRSLDARLRAIEAKLDQLAAGGLVVAAPPTVPAGATAADVLDLMTFGV